MGFLWMDGAGRRIAIRIAGDDREPGMWLAKGLCIADDCRLLDPVHRESLQGRVRRRLGNARRGSGRYAALAHQLHHLALIDLGLRLLPWLHAQCSPGPHAGIIVGKQRLAELIWGPDEFQWPASWSSEIWAALSMLGDLRCFRLALPKPGWQPSFTAAGSALSVVEALPEGRVGIRAAPALIDVLPQFISSPTHDREPL
jgi:hypothetical protein